MSQVDVRMAVQIMFLSLSLWHIALSRTYVGHCSHVMGIRFSPDNYYVMSMGGDDRSAMQWRVLPIAQDDIVVDKPVFADYQVYQPPKKVAMVIDGGVSLGQQAEVFTPWYLLNVSHIPPPEAYRCLVK